MRSCPRMVTVATARSLALSLPEASERDHHGRPSFRVGGRIFATLWDGEHMNVMLDEPGIRTAVAAHPACCAEVHWGRRLAAVRVALPAVPRELLADALGGQGTGAPRARSYCGNAFASLSRPNGLPCGRRRRLSSARRGSRRPPTMSTQSW